MSYIEHFQFCRVVEPGFCCCVEIDGALPVGLKIFPKLWQDLDGFEASLSQVLPHLRKQRLNKVAEHIHSCPICQQCVWILLDGKQGARRFICAGLEGHRTFADLGVSIYTGCMNHAGPNDVFCKRCRPSSLLQSALIPQEKVLQVETCPSEDGLSVETWYLVRCKCPQNGIFEAPLPRKEVRADLLAEFEKGALPKKRDHGNLRTQFRWLKSARMVRQAALKRAGPCKPARRGRASKKEEVKKLPGGWLSQAYVAFLRDTDKSTDGSELAECGIDKEKKTLKRRRCTGGILTATLSCGQLVDWLELPRGEALDVVYTFVLDVIKELSTRQVQVKCVGYDNACRLLAMAERCENLCSPWTNKVTECRIVLDRFHKGNHSWCLRHRPQAPGKLNKRNTNKGNVREKVFQYRSRLEICAFALSICLQGHVVCSAVNTRSSTTVSFASLIWVTSSCVFEKDCESMCNALAASILLNQMLPGGSRSSRQHSFAAVSQLGEL